MFQFPPEWEDGYFGIRVAPEDLNVFIEACLNHGDYISNDLKQWALKYCPEDRIFCYKNGCTVYVTYNEDHYCRNGYIDFKPDKSTTEDFQSLL